jgi:Putative auto-transporter adhesin, head GIN domain
MRTFLIAAAAVPALASSAHAATRNFGITGFEKVRVEGPYKVRLATGVAPFATASGSAAALDRVAIEMRGNTLVVHGSTSSWGGYPGGNAGPVEISLGTHDLSSAWISGSGALAVDKVKGLSFDLSVQGSAAAAIAQANVDQLHVAVVGTGSATLAGQAGNVTAIVRGVSTLDAANLAAKDATIGAEGTATIAARVSNSVKVDGNGAVTVRLSGGPACTLRVSGSASVSGCRSTH